MISCEQPTINNPELLLTQVEELRHEIKQVNHMNTLNRSVIQMLSQTKCPDNQLFYKVIVHLLEQVETQGQTIKRLILQKNQKSAKNQINQRILANLSSFDKIHDQNIRDQLQSLKMEVNSKNNKLREYQQKIGEVDYLTGFATKTINIFDPSEQTLRFNDEVLNLNRLILTQQEANNKLSKENGELIKINLALKSEIQKKKVEIHNIRQFNDTISDNLDQSKIQSHRINSSTIQSERSYLPKQDTSFAFLRFQKTIVDEQTDSDFDPQNLCPELSVMFPEKVEKIKKKKETFLPRLNMERVRVIMKKNRKKIDQELRNNVHVNPTQKILDLELQLQGTRRELSKYILKEKQLVAFKERCQRLIEELEGRNVLLVQSNTRLQQNWRQIFKQLRFCQQVVKTCEQIIEKSFFQLQKNEGQQKLMGQLSDLVGVKRHKQKQIDKILNFVHAMRNKDGHELHRSKSGEI